MSWLSCSNRALCCRVGMGCRLEHDNFRERTGEDKLSVADSVGVTTALGDEKGRFLIFWADYLKLLKCWNKKLDKGGGFLHTVRYR